MKAIAMLPSPTPLETRLMESWRTSPSQKTPGRLVSSGNGSRSSVHVVRSRPVQMYPFASRCSSGGSQAVLLLNRGADVRSVVVDWNSLRLPSYLKVSVRDLGRRRNLRRAAGRLAATVGPHAARLLKVTPTR